MENLIKILSKIIRILKREKKHLHLKDSWRYDKNMKKVKTNEDEF